MLIALAIVAYLVVGVLVARFKYSHREIYTGTTYPEVEDVEHSPLCDSVLYSYRGSRTRCDCWVGKRNLKAARRQYDNSTVPYRHYILTWPIATIGLVDHAISGGTRKKPDYNTIDRIQRELEIE